MKENVPEFRFEGFTDTWEQRKLGQLCESFEYGLNVSAKEYDGKNKYLRITDIDDETRRFLYSNLTSPNIDINEASEYLLKAGAILFSRTGASVGKTYLYDKSDGDVYYAGFLIKAQISNNYSPEFVFQNTLTNRYLQFVQITSQRSGQPGINAQEYANYCLEVPSLQEQQSIGSFFSTLDHLITLQQRELDYLKETKKTMLSELFPKKSETIPGVRFDGFTDAWEQRKLKEMIQKEVKGRAKSSMSGTKSIYLDTEYLNGGSKTYVDSATDVQETDILILWDGSQAGTVYYGFSGALGSTLKAFHPVESGRFIFDQLKAKETVIFERYRTPNIPHVIKSFTEEFELFRTIPSEQQSIGSFFSSLDHLITLQQRKLDLLKSQKQTLLKSMFPR